MFCFSCCERAGNGSEILQGEQPVPARGAEPIGEGNEGGAVPSDVQGGIEEGTAQEEIGQPVGISEQLPASEVYSLSEQTDNEGNRFYQKNGSIDLWDLSPLFEQARRQNAPIRLTERNIDHILDEHKKELGDSEESVLAFLDNVFSNATVLRKARSGGIFVVVNNTKTDKAAIIRLYPSKYGDYYNVESAGYYRKNKWKDSENVIAELSEPTQSVTASDVSKPQVPEEGGRELLNAETATTSASEDRNIVSNSQENAQESGEKSAVPSVKEQIQAAEAEVNTNPTEAPVKAETPTISQESEQVSDQVSDAVLIKGAKWNATGEPEKMKWRTKKHKDSHDITWYIGKKRYGSTTAERDLLRVLADEYGNLNAIWNAYEQNQIILSSNEAAILKKLIESNSTTAELQQGSLTLDRESPAFERATARTVEQAKSILPVEIATPEQAMAVMGAEQQMIAEANERFNKELDAFKENRHKGLLHLGAPMGVLSAAGVNAKELTVSPKVLNRKMEQHGLLPDDLKGLAEAVQSPILVYRHGDKVPNLVVVTELDVKGGKLSVAIELDDRGNVVEINNVSSVHSKDAATELVRLANMGTNGLQNGLRWVEKEKVQDWLGVADLNRPIHTDNPELVSVAKVINSFENPKVEPEIMRTSNGTLYGWAVNGKIYLTPDGLNPDTPVHEYTHLWASAVEKSNPELWARIVEGLKASPVWNEVLTDENYRDIWGNENRVASEVLSRLSGRENYNREMERAREEIKGAQNVIDAAEKITLRERVKQTLNDFWNKVKSLVGLPVKGEPKSDVPSWVEFVEMSLKDFWAGVKPEKVEGATAEKMFIGEKGATALDKAQEATTRLDNLSVAREMETAGKDAKVIKLATGWERGADGKWRYEVEDLGQLDLKPINLSTELVNGKAWIDGEITLGELFYNNELFKSYPALKDVKIAFGNFENSKIKGEYDAETNTISLPKEALQMVSMYGEDNVRKQRELFKEIDALNAEPTKENIELAFAKLEEVGKLSDDAIRGINIDMSKYRFGSVLAHEIQHAIQYIEGFARGSSPERFADVRNAVLSSLNFMTNGDLLKGSAISDVQSLRDALDKIIPYTEMSIKDGYAEELQKVAKKYGYENIDALVNDYENMPSAFLQYLRTAGEVESRNVQERMGMTEEERRNSLAAETEDVAREDQIFIYDNLGSAMMGSRVDARMAEVASYFDGKLLTEQQRAVVDVFGGKADNLTISVKTTDGNTRNVVMRQGNEMGAGAKHSLFRHYGTSKGAISAEDIALIPDVIAKGEREEKQRGNVKLAVYRLTGDSGTRFTVVTEIKEKGEVFNDFYTNKKAPNQTPQMPKGDTQSARTNDLNASTDKGSNNSSNVQEGDILYRDWYGGNSGYEGYSMSKRAAEAREEGRYPKSDFKKVYNVSQEALDALVKAGVIDNSEWHHTSKYGNRTTFYGWEEPGYAEVYANNKAEIDKRAKEVVAMKPDHSVIERNYTDEEWETYAQQFNAHKEAERQLKKDLQAMFDEVVSREGYGPLTDSEVATESDVYAKALGRPRYTGKKLQEYVARQRGKMVERANELAKKLHLDNVEVVTDASTLEGKKQRAKGFYSKSTGKITIVIPNHSSTFDVEQTLLHEAVAHYGLRQLFGERFDTFLDNVYNNASAEVLAEIDRLAREKYNGNRRTATEEYLASLAEDTNFENAERSSWFRKIKDFFLDMLHKIGFENIGGVTFTDNELRYILWRSYENLAEPGRYRSIIGEAADIAKQYDLGVGNFAGDASNALLVADAANDDLFRDGTPATEEFINATVVASNWGNTHKGAAPCIVIQSAETLRAQLEQAGVAEEDIQDLLSEYEKEPSKRAGAMFVPDSDIVVVIDSTLEGRNLKSVLWHEATHRAIRLFFGEDGNAVQQLYDSMPAEKRKEWEAQFKKKGYKPEEYAEEALCYFVENLYLHNFINDRNSDAISKLTDINSADFVKCVKFVQPLIDFITNGQKGETNRSGTPGGGILGRNGQKDTGVHLRNAGNESGETRKGIKARRGTGVNAPGTASALYENAVRRKGGKGYQEKVAITAHKLQEAYQDSMLALDELQKAITAETGNTIETYEDAYMAENAMSSRNRAEIEAFEHLLYDAKTRAMLEGGKFKAGEGATDESKILAEFIKPIIKYINNGGERGYNPDGGIRESVGENQGGYVGQHQESLEVRNASNESGDTRKGIKARRGETTLSFDEAIAQGLMELAAKNSEDYQLRVDALKSFTKLIKEAADDLAAARVIRGVAARQKDYDKATVQKVISLARLIMNNSLIDNFTRGEVKRLIGAIHRAVGKKELMTQGTEIVNLLADRQIKACDELLSKQLKTKASKINANAFAESFNAKIKAFRAQLRGVTDLKFFFFRLAKLFA